MTDIVERMRWWGAKRRPPQNMPTLIADCTEAADEIERLRTELQHFYARAVDDPGKNPPTFWKDRCASLESALEKIDTGYGPNHLSKYARDIAHAALDSVRDLSARERKVNE
jgi:hypothetical protein